MLRQPACRPDSDDAMERLRELGGIYLTALNTARDVSADIAQEVAVANTGGSSLVEISAASGLSVPQIEYILVAVNVQRQLTDYSLSRWGESIFAGPNPHTMADRRNT